MTELMYYGLRLDARSHVQGGMVVLSKAVVMVFALMLQTAFSGSYLHRLESPRTVVGGLLSHAINVQAFVDMPKYLMAGFLDAATAIVLRTGIRGARYELFGTMLYTRVMR